MLELKKKPIVDKTRPNPEPKEAVGQEPKVAHISEQLRRMFPTLLGSDRNSK